MNIQLYHKYITIYYGLESTFVHSPFRDVLKVLYPEREDEIELIDTVFGLRYRIQVVNTEIHSEGPVS